MSSFFELGQRRKEDHGKFPATESSKFPAMWEWGDWIPATIGKLWVCLQPVSQEEVDLDLAESI